MVTGINQGNLGGLCKDNPVMTPHLLSFWDSF